MTLQFTANIKSTTHLCQTEKPHKVQRRLDIKLIQIYTKSGKT